LPGRGSGSCGSLPTSVPRPRWPCWPRHTGRSSTTPDPTTPPAATGRSRSTATRRCTPTFTPAILSQLLDAGHIEQSIGPSAPTRARVTHTVSNVGAFIRIGCSVAADPEGPTASTTPPRRRARPRHPRPDPKTPKPPTVVAVDLAVGVGAGVVEVGAEVWKRVSGSDSRCHTMTTMERPTATRVFF
jgi:hypothetical protein